jgi:predicted CoA-substrate-specific enzyme activase
MKSYVMGIDFGSTTAKTVILDLKGRIVSSNVSHMGAVSGDGLKASIAGALEEAGIAQADVGRTVSTGYGRRMIDVADKNFTEITCHARGAIAMTPDARLVIDIGGQDSKAITVDEDGLVEDFAMNDRCASGTGRFYEVLARALECELDELPALALRGSRDLEVSSMCATFAETEIVSLLAQGLPAPDIASSVHRAIAARTLALVAQVGKRTPVVLTGGVARNRAAVRFLADALDLEVQVPARPQITGAYGAALLAVESAGRAPDQADADMSVPLFPGPPGSDRSCTDCDGTTASVVELGPAIAVRPA